MTTIQGIQSITGINTITYGGFLPSDIAGLTVWLDASQITGKVDGDALATWSDLSGNGYDAVKGSFNGPTYETNELNGHPIIRFVAASSQALRVAVVVSTPYTAFIVGRLTSGANGRLFGGVYGAGGSNYLLGWWNGYEDTMYAEGFVKGGTVGATTNWHLYTGKVTGAVTSFYDFGVSLASNGLGLFGITGGIALSGYSPTGAGELSNGEIAEVIIYNTALSDVDREAVETYLTTKYAF